MNHRTTTIAKARPAATAVPICESSEGIEVLLLKRNTALSFGGGDWVFPGGRIDEHELNNELDDLATAKIAAIREAQEEAQLILAEHQLHYYSRWIAPEFFPKRFDTWFFIALINKQAVTVDHSEIIDHQWLSPARALEIINAGQMSVMPPTYITLYELAQRQTFGELRQMMLDHKPVVFLPKPYQDGDDFCMLYPGDALYNSPEDNSQSCLQKHRLYIRADKSFNYINTSNT